MKKPILLLLFSFSLVLTQAADYTLYNAFNFGTGLDETVFASTVDSKGSLYITGKFFGTIDFDPGAGSTLKTAKNNTKGSMYLAKYDSTGVFQWVTVEATTNESYGWDLDVDHNDNIYLCERIAYSTTGKHEMGMVKYNSTTGAMIWGKMTTTFSTGAQCQGNGVEILPNGNPVFLGAFVGDVNVGTEVVNAGSQWQPGIVELNAANGNTEELIRVQSGGDIYAYGMSVNSISKKMAITGWYKGSTVDFDGDNVYEYTEGPSNQDAFVCVYDAEVGNEFTILNTFRYGGGNIQQGHRVLVRDNGNIVTAGNTYQSIDLDPGTGTIVSPFDSNYDNWCVETTDAGDYVNHLFLSNAWYCNATVLKEDGKGGFYLGGWINNTTGTLTGASTKFLTGVSDYDGFIFNINSSWAVAKEYHFNGPGADFIRSLSGYGKKLHLVGSFGGTHDFDPNGGYNLTSTGGTDMFVQSFNTDFGLPTSKQEIDSHEFLAYPNPVSDILNIESDELATMIKIYDTSGKLILKEKVSQLKNQINTASLANGLYLVQLTFADDSNSTFSLVK